MQETPKTMNQFVPVVAVAAANRIIQIPVEEIANVVVNNFPTYFNITMARIYGPFFLHKINMPQLKCVFLP